LYPKETQNLLRFLPNEIKEKEKKILAKTVGRRAQRSYSFLFPDGT
jgi:hypothetical protein